MCVLHCFISSAHTNSLPLWVVHDRDLPRALMCVARMSSLIDYSNEGYCKFPVEGPGPEGPRPSLQSNSSTGLSPSDQLVNPFAVGGQASRDRIECDRPCIRTLAHIHGRLRDPRGGQVRDDKAVVSLCKNRVNQRHDAGIGGGRSASVKSFNRPKLPLPTLEPDLGVSLTGIVSASIIHFHDVPAHKARSERLHKFTLVCFHIAK